MMYASTSVIRMKFLESSQKNPEVAPFSSQPYGSMLFIDKMDSPNSSDAMRVPVKRANSFGIYSEDSEYGISIHLAISSSLGKCHPLGQALAAASTS